MVFLCSGVRAQEVIEPAMVNPGARSLGLGGAFVALADDATAAYANPAGGLVPDSDVLHSSAGIGIDVSNETTTVSLSGIVVF
jgi:hypothetical protein